MSLQRKKLNSLRFRLHRSETHHNIKVVTNWSERENGGLFRAEYPGKRGRPPLSLRIIPILADQIHHVQNILDVAEKVCHARLYDVFRRAWMLM